MIRYKYNEIEKGGTHHPPNCLIKGYVNTWDEHIFEVRISEFKNVTSNATYDKIMQSHSVNPLQNTAGCETG